MTTTHKKCPVLGCANLITGVNLMCALHWRQVPKAIQDAVWTEFRKQAGSVPHIKACQAAVRSASGSVITQRN